MKKISALIFISLFLFVLFSLLKPQPKKTSHPENYSSQEVSASFANNSNKPLIIKKPPINDNDINSLEISTESKKTNNSELDYISAYRDWQYFENCYTDIEDFGNETDPLETLALRFANNSRESQQEPTAQQNIYYQHHVDICKTLINDVGDEKNDYHQIMDKLQQRFERIKAKTQEEKNLSQALQMIQQLHTYQLQYTQAHRRQSTLTPEVLNSRNSQIEQLTTDMLQVYESSNDLTPEQIQLIQKYNAEIEELNLVLFENNRINYSQIKLIENQMDAFLISMDRYLQQVKSPDAFLIISKVLYQSEYFQKDSTILKALKIKTGIQDSYYLNILNNIVMPLVACSMNYPCDAESDLILSYCLGLKDSMFNQACGSNLEDFYFNFYIGLNQLTDVNNYFSYLVNRYAN